MDKEKLRDEGLNYLVTSNFVDAYVKKLMFRTDIDNLYEDYRQEAYVAICEQKPEIWEQLYNSSIEKGKPFDYEIRNYFSTLIRNVVRSTSSNAYRKLKKPLLKEKVQDAAKWDVLKSQLTETKSVEQQIVELNYNE